MYVPNFIEIGQTFFDGHTDGRTEVPTDGRTFPPLMLLGRLGGVHLKTERKKEETTGQKYNAPPPIA